MNQIVCDMCRRAASAQTTISYADVARRIGISTTGEGWRYQIGPLLDEVSRYEHAEGHPLLSVVVVREDTSRPGQGFFVLARELGKFDGIDEEAFFIAELNATYAAWRR